MFGLIGVQKLKSSELERSFVHFDEGKHKGYVLRNPMDTHALFELLSA